MVGRLFPWICVGVQSVSSRFSPTNSHGICIWWVVSCNKASAVMYIRFHRHHHCARWLPRNCWIVLTSTNELALTLLWCVWWVSSWVCCRFPIVAWSMSGRLCRCCWVVWVGHLVALGGWDVQRFFLGGSIFLAAGSQGSPVRTEQIRNDTLINHPFQRS